MIELYMTTIARLDQLVEVGAGRSRRADQIRDELDTMWSQMPVDTMRRVEKLVNALRVTQEMRDGD